MRSHAIQQLVADARKIAAHREYPNLVNGLQPIPVLMQKYLHEWEEFKEAVAKGELLHVLHEASDVLYYASCLDTQSPDFPGVPYDGFYHDAMVFVRYDLDIKLEHPMEQEPIEAAALAKYDWRASGKHNKDEAYELQLIESAIKPERG